MAAAGELEPIEVARGQHARGDLEAAAATLRECSEAHDLEHVAWLSSICRSGHGPHAIQAQALRLLAAWAARLQANVPEDGVPMQDVLRDELIDSAVTFLEDEQVADRTVEEKVRFLQDKGLNRTEIRVAFAQVGLEAPASLQFAEPFRADVVENGAAFLGMAEIKAKPLEERLAFLKAKGLTNGEIVRACEVAETERVPSAEELDALQAYQARAAREDMIKNGVVFLGHPSVKGKTVQEKLEFLVSKGMTAQELEESCRRAGVQVSAELREKFMRSPAESARGGASADAQSPAAATAPAAPAAEPAASPQPPKLREQEVGKGVSFLTHPSVATRSMAERLGFLRQKGLSEAELEEACKRAGGDNVYSAAPGGSAGGDSSANVEKAVRFLQHPSSQARSMADRVQFLRAKGLDKEEIKEAFAKAGISVNFTSGTARRGLESSLTSGTVRRGLVSSFTSGTSDSEDGLTEQAVKFLLSSKAAGVSTGAKARFLLDKGLSQSQVLAALAKVGLALTEEELEAALAEAALEDADAEPQGEETKRVMRFLLDEGLRDTPLTEKIEHLRAQGKSKADIQTALQAIGMDAAQAKDALGDPELDAKRVAALEAFLRTLRARAGAPTPDSVGERSFLRSKGFSDDQIEAAYARMPPSPPAAAAGGPGGAREAQVANAVAFLRDTVAQEASASEKVAFLRGKGLSDEEVTEAFRRAGVPLGDLPPRGAESAQSARAKLVEQGVRFLQSEHGASLSMEEKRAFLANKGLTKEEVDQAVAAAGPAAAAHASLAPEVRQAVAFLRKSAGGAHSRAEQRRFLAQKGLDSAQIEQAFAAAGLSPEDEDAAPSNGELVGFDAQRAPLVRKARDLLRSTAGSALKPADKIAFLRDKGLTEDEIQQALHGAGLDDADTSGLERATLREDQVARGAAFLTSPDMADVALEDRLTFLQEKGLTEHEVLEAAIRAKVELVPSHISTIPTRKLKEDREIESPEMDATGRALQRATNVAVDLLSRLKDQAPRKEPVHTEVAVRAMALVATALCRCRPARVSPACVAYAARILRMALSEARGVRVEALESALVSDFLEAAMELVARANQVDLYAKRGLNQQQQVNLHFISARALLLRLMGVWRADGCIDFAHGILVARAVHGSFCSTAAVLPFKDVGAPVVEVVAEQLGQQRDAVQDVAAYVAAGLLRGGPDYAWGKDVKASPQPALEAALQRLARSAVERFETADLAWTMAAGNGPQHQEHARAKGLAVAVGLACVYADTQVRWDTAVLMAVTEGLLNGALWCAKALEASEENLDARAQAATDFTSTEIFQLAPQLVSLLQAKLPSGLGLAEPEALLARWMIARLNRHSRLVLIHCRLVPSLCGIVARRTVHLVYGTGKDEEPEEREEPAESEAGNLPAELFEDDRSADGDSEDEEDEEDEEEKPAPPPPKDPLAEYLGVHSGIARLLQMSYLATVLLGSPSVASADTDGALAMLDALANLNAFQVRVQEAVELEALLQAMIGLEGTDEDPRSAEAVYALMASHAELHESARALLPPGQADAGQSPIFDWVLGARVEFLCGLGEGWLLPRLRAAAKAPAPPLPSVNVADEDRREQLRRSYWNNARGSVATARVLGAFDAALKQSAKKRTKRKKRTRKDAPPSCIVEAAEAAEAAGPPASLDAQAETFANGLCEILLEIGVRHPFVHLNVRAHRWLTDTVADIDPAPSDGEGATMSAAHPFRLAVIPRYMEVAVESFPTSTPARVLSFAVASVLTSLGRDPDEHAQTFAAMAFDRLTLAVDKRDEHSPALSTLAFTALKAISLPALPRALWAAADLIERAPASDVAEPEGPGAEAEPLTHDWFVENLFGVITRTEDARRRLLLAQWYLETILGRGLSGHL